MNGEPQDMTHHDEDYATHKKSITQKRTALELKVIDLELKESKLKMALRSIKNQREFQVGPQYYHEDSAWITANDALND